MTTAIKTNLDFENNEIKNITAEKYKAVLMG